jgi:hypothetical protein
MDDDKEWFCRLGSCMLQDGVLPEFSLDVGLQSVSMGRWSEKPGHSSK